MLVEAVEILPPAPKKKEKKESLQWLEVVGFPNVLVWREASLLRSDRLDGRVWLRLKLHQLGLCEMPTGVMDSSLKVVDSGGFMQFREWAQRLEGQLSPNLIVRMRLPRPKLVGATVESFRDPTCLVSFPEKGKIRFADLWVGEGEDRREFDSFSAWLKSHGLLGKSWSALVHPEDAERQKRAVHVNLTWGYDNRVFGIRAWVLKVGTGVVHGRELDGSRGSVGEVIGYSLGDLGKVLNIARFGGGGMVNVGVRLIGGSREEFLRSMTEVGKVWDDLWVSVAVLAKEFGMPEERMSIDARIYRQPELSCHVYDVKGIGSKKC